MTMTEQVGAFCFIVLIDFYNFIVSWFYRFRAIQVRGKSTRGIRKVFVVIPEFLLPKLETLADVNHHFLFAG